MLLMLWKSLLQLPVPLVMATCLESSGMSQHTLMESTQIVAATVDHYLEAAEHNETHYRVLCPKTATSPRVGTTKRIKVAQRRSGK